MKFSDRMKFALHNMWTSKSRTILTILIVFIVSTLIQVVGIVCINFASNLNTMMSEQLDENGSEYYIGYKSDLDNWTGNYPEGFGIETIDSVHNTVKNDPTSGMVSYSNNSQTNVRIANSSCTLSSFDFRMPMNNVETIEGRCWNADDYNTNAIFVDKNFLDVTNKNNGTNYTLNDTVSINFTTYNQNDKTETFQSKFIIKGIFSYPNDNYNYNNAKLSFDVSYLINQFNYTYNSARINNPKLDTGNTLAIINLYNKTIDALNPLLKSDAQGKYVATNSFIEESMMIIIMDVVIIGIGLVIGFIVLLLSIGSIANTMIISIDKNKKFTGLMMAMGLKPKSIKGIIRLESAMTIISGILLSTILCLAFIPVFTSVLTSIFNSLFYGAVTFKFAFPFYFPIGVAFVFILMAMLFTKGGVSGLIKQDPITVISEVG